jgi:secreted PhoX family phosphatase
MRATVHIVLTCGGASPEKVPPMRRRHITALGAAAAVSAIGASVALAAGTSTGPSSSQSPYLLPSAPDVTTKSILTVGDAAANAYRMVGVPDGLGAYETGGDTFTVLMNHEYGPTAGAVRAHGARGAFVSRWTIDKRTLRVVKGEDLIKRLAVWNGTGYDAPATGGAPGLALARLCAATLADPSAFGGIRLFTNGEEQSDGRAFAHGLDGTSYQLPRIGRYAHENVVPRPARSRRTVVVSTDDTTPGQVYVYTGEKQKSGTPVDRAGLTNGSLSAIKVDGSRFSTVDLGDVSNESAAQLEQASDDAGATEFARPEDGAWDPRDPDRFYFVTTDRFDGRSQLFALDFADGSRPELGGTISVLLDGTEGYHMLDNVDVDRSGRLILQEDVGNNAWIGRIYSYEPATDTLAEIAHHDPDRFLTGGSSFLTQDEESSGVIDVASILGKGWFLADDQAHYAHPEPDLVEGGQLFALHVPTAEDDDEHGDEHGDRD